MVPTVWVARGDGRFLELPTARPSRCRRLRRGPRPARRRPDGALVREALPQWDGARTTLHLSQSVGKSVLGLLVEELRLGVRRHRSSSSCPRSPASGYDGARPAAPARHDRGDRLRRGLRASSGATTPRARRHPPAPGRPGNDPGAPADHRARRVAGTARACITRRRTPTCSGSSPSGPAARRYAELFARGLWAPLGRRARRAADRRPRGDRSDRRRLLRDAARLRATRGAGAPRRRGACRSPPTGSRRLGVGDPGRVRAQHLGHDRLERLRLPVVVDRRRAGRARHPRPARGGGPRGGRRRRDPLPPGPRRRRRARRPSARLRVRRHCTGASAAGSSIPSKHKQRELWVGVGSTTRVATNVVFQPLLGGRGDTLTPVAPARSRLLPSRRYGSLAVLPETPARRPTHPRTRSRRDGPLGHQRGRRRAARGQTPRTRWRISSAPASTSACPAGGAPRSRGASNRGRRGRRRRSSSRAPPSRLAKPRGVAPRRSRANAARSPRLNASTRPAGDLELAFPRRRAQDGEALLERVPAVVHRLPSRSVQNSSRSTSVARGAAAAAEGDDVASHADEQVDRHRRQPPGAARATRERRLWRPVRGPRRTTPR